MGLCASRSSARSTDGSEKSDKCRWDKHGNVFFPVRRTSNTLQEEAATRRVFTAKNLFSNPMYNASPDSGNSSKGHFSGFARLLKGSRGTVVEHKKHPLSPSRSGKSSCKEMLEAKAVSDFGQQSTQQGDGTQKHAGERLRKHAPLIKFIEAEKVAAASLSRSSSAKEGSLTRSSSTKDAALSRCSSDKEGKRELLGTENTSDQSATIASLKTASFRIVDKGVPEQQPGKNEETKSARESRTAEAAVKRSTGEDSTTSFLTKGLGMPCYQPLVFRAVSPDKCRGRASSTHSSMSGDELGGVAPRRRSPNRRSSPGKRSPRKRSPSKVTGGNGGFTLNPSAARFQRSLPGSKVESQKSSARPPQFPKFSAVKNNDAQQNRAVLKELQLNGVKSQARRQSSPVKGLVKKPSPATKNITTSTTRSEKFSVYSDAIHLDIHSGSSSETVLTEVPGKGSCSEENSLSIMKEPRSGSKRLRSPKKPLPEQRLTREFLNFNISLDDVEAEADSSKDKYIDTQGHRQNNAVEDKEMINEEDIETYSPEPELLELLERTPKKLKKMALKLALMIELEHSKEDDECSGEVVQQGDKGQSNQNDVDLELKLGLPNQRNKRRIGDGIRLDFSVAMNSPTRAGSASVPATPRHSVSSICNGLSVEARIGSSRGQSKYSDFSFHVMKNPEKLFGNASQLHVSRTSEQRAESDTSSVKSSVLHVNASAHDVAVDMTASQHQDHDEDGSCRGSSPLVERCPSFGFENDARLPARKLDDRQAPGEVGEIRLAEGESTPTKTHGLDLNRDEETSSPGFEFKVRSGASTKSSPATPIMPSAPKSETDALSLSADEIAEIWGAFEAGQDGKICCS